MRKLILGLLLSAALPASSHGAVLISVQEVGSDVVVTAKGSLDLSGLSYGGTVVQSSYVEPSLGYIPTGGLDGHE
jgi:hypothetical protein